MKKGVVILLLAMLLVFPLVQAQEQVQTYSGFEKFTDNIKLFFSSGDSEVRLALEIREKEVNSAIQNSLNGDSEEAIKNLEQAENKLQLIQEKVSLNTSEEIKNSVGEIKEKIDKEGLSEDFEDYVTEEEKTQLTAELTLKTFEYCKELSKEGYQEMLKEEICNPETAQKGLEKELEELKDIQIKLFVQLMLEIRSCIDDPGTCNCDDNLDVEQKAKCEKMVALAVKCEYKQDEDSCSELKAMEPEKGDGFAESFVPEFLMNLFREKEEKMIDYDIEPSCGVPEECWDENDKPECKQYEHLKETSADWDEYGNYIGHERKCDEQIPTMQQSIPQCFDGDVFLEEKCGNISIIRNEEGLINYIIGKEIDEVVEKFENASEQHMIDVNGSEGRTMSNEIKVEIDGIKDEIAVRTFAEGTFDTGDSEDDVQKNVVEEGNSHGDDGLKPEVEIETSGGSGGDDGLSPEVENDGGSGSGGGDGGESNVVESSEGGDDGGSSDSGGEGDSGSSE